MPLSRGDVILIPVPDTSGKPGKTRPALVVSSNWNNYRLHDVIVAVITSTTKRARLERLNCLLKSQRPKESKLVCSPIPPLNVSAFTRSFRASPFARSEVSLPPR
ncbi:MAG: type II toxin-antitoxin system PemK/MazF family toxin [Gemmataceae bacterium]|nr:type II toxin-antitoxin system PemK/MazF family toxin [Gemmataceae bacterium]